MESTDEFKWIRIYDHQDIVGYINSKGDGSTIRRSEFALSLKNLCGTDNKVKPESVDFIISSIEMDYYEAVGHFENVSYSKVIEKSVSMLLDVALFSKYFEKDDFKRLKTLETKILALYDGSLNQLEYFVADINGKKKDDYC